MAGFFQVAEHPQLQKIWDYAAFFQTTKGKEGRKAWPAGVSPLGHLSVGAC